MPRRLRRGPRRPGRPQLRTQVLAGVLLVMLVALTAFDAAAVSALRRYLLSRTDSSLQSVLRLYQPWPRPPGRPGPTTARPPPALRAAPPGLRNPGQARSATVVGPRVKLRPSILDQYYLVFLSRDRPPKTFIEGNPELVPRRLGSFTRSVARRSPRTVVSVRGNVQLRLQAVPRADGTLVASTSIAEVNRTVGRLELILVIGSAVAGLVVAAGVIVLLRRGLRPIETMAAQADRITAGDLTDRVSPHDPRTEVGRLGTALNGMLARIEASVVEQARSQERTRRFFADASHELRTPLASLRANAELYQQGALRRRPEVDEAMRRITLEATRMSKLVDDMLRLARLDQHPGQDNEAVDLSALVTGCAERARLAGEQRTWLTDIAPGLATAGDEELLRRAVDNLLANVSAHTPADTVATVSAAGHGDRVTIEVSDNGPGVPADRLPSIFDRFYRATPARAHCPGSGLGLAIVAAVAATHHGTAMAELNDPHGLRVTLALPASSSAGQCPRQVPAPWLTAQTVRHELRQSDRHDRGGGDRRADHLPGDRAR
ncbi:MAG TPA: HAMP domain-containing sensor histidine kinase [Streptosporangiaceae bacterium]|nr:HAMP domain-containing sensor histidine kinase [Streptosporangiaceae bacterium]